MSSNIPIQTTERPIIAHPLSLASAENERNHRKNMYNLIGVCYHNFIYTLIPTYNFYKHYY